MTILGDPQSPLPEEVAACCGSIHGGYPYGYLMDERLNAEPLQPISLLPSMRWIEYLR
jgi:hypothetical protein